MRMKMVVWPFLAPAAAYVADQTRVICYAQDVTEHFVAKFCGLRLNERDAERRIGGRMDSWSRADLSAGSCKKMEDLYPLDFRNWARCEHI